MRTPIPGRGALRSQGTNPHQPTYNRKQRGAPGWCSLLFRNGKRDPYSRRGASDFPRIVANTPGPWKGRIEVAGDGSASQNTKQQGEPLRSSLLLWSGKRDSHSRAARVISRELLPTPPAPGREALRSRGTGPPLKTQSNRENLKGSPCCFGAENGTRTRDLNLGKVALYQLSYFRMTFP